MKITKANGVVEYQLLAQLKQRAGETDPTPPANDPGAEDTPVTPETAVM